MSYPPKIFISHCEKSMAPTEYAIRIIELLGCVPMIAERQAKGSNSVNDVVRNLLDTCDAAMVIVTGDQTNGDKRTPSNGVSVELGILETIPKFKSKYFVVIEEGVTMSAMNNMAWTSFTMSNFAPIATAILAELGSMNLFRNYYQMPGSDSNLHQVLETLNALKTVGANGALNNDLFKSSVSTLITEFINNYTNKP